MSLPGASEQRLEPRVLVIGGALKHLMWSDGKGARLFRGDAVCGGSERGPKTHVSPRSPGKQPFLRERPWTQKAAAWKPPLRLCLRHAQTLAAEVAACFLPSRHHVASGEGRA